MRALGHEPRKEDLKKLVTEVDKDNTGQLDFDGCAPPRRWNTAPPALP